jgi:hypothetical protein
VTSASLAVPLLVELYRTLVRTDTLCESTLVLLRGAPRCAFILAVCLNSGTVRIRHEIADRVTLDLAGMPYKIGESSQRELVAFPA